MVAPAVTPTSDPPSVPPEKNDIASKRSFSIGMTKVCRTCHADKFEQWDTSIHAALVRSGNPGAPICTDCHNPHAVIKDAATKVDQVPCKNCHAEIYTAYRGSMHAQARPIPRTALRRSAPAATPPTR